MGEVRKKILLMKLIDAIDQLDSFDEDLTIYVDSRLVLDSEAVLACEPEDGSLPEEARGLVYFIEVYLAREVLEVWSQWRQDEVPSREDKYKALVYYVKNDDYLPVEE